MAGNLRFGIGLLLSAIASVPPIGGQQGYAGPNACQGDVNDDGVTNVADLLALLAQFGSECGPDTCPDGDVSTCAILGDLNDDCRERALSLPAHSCVMRLSRARVSVLSSTSVSPVRTFR